VAEVVRQQDLMGWPDSVPKYAEVPHPDGEARFWLYQDLTVAACEQLVEHHTRQARAALRRYEISQAVRSLRKAGRNILYARLYRCKYMELIGREDFGEEEMPFPVMKWPPTETTP
jgi:hypothetical protein